MEARIHSQVNIPLPETGGDTEGEQRGGIRVERDDSEGAVHMLGMPGNIFSRIDIENSPVNLEDRSRGQGQGRADPQGFEQSTAKLIYTLVGGWKGILVIMYISCTALSLIVEIDNYCDPSMKIWLVIISCYLVLRICVHKVLKPLRESMENQVTGDAPHARSRLCMFAVASKLLELMDVFGVNTLSYHICIVLFDILIKYSFILSHR